MNSDGITRIQEVLGYKFDDLDLLRLALRHASAAPRNNEALACLGDRIHNVWVARRVFERLPGAGKGKLTHEINPLCERATQADLFSDLGLHEHLAVGGAILGAGDPVSTPMAATAFEALVAAIEIDGGQAAAEALLVRVLGNRIAELS
jgi:ribonuclease III